jgi:hypothetical protein
LIAGVHTCAFNLSHLTAFSFTVLSDPVILFTPDEASSKGRDRQEYIDEAFIVSTRNTRN